MERFRTCDECSRHVRVSEAKCPFCGHALEAAALAPVPRAPAQLSRAQRIALIAAVAGSIAGCADDGASNMPSGQGVAGAAAGASAAGGRSAGAAGKGATGPGAAGAIAVPVYGAPAIPPEKSGGASGAGASGSGSAGQSGAAGAAHGGSGGSAGEAGAAGSAGNHAAAGSGGAAGSAGKPAAAGSGGVMVHPLYGASPAYGLPPVPTPEK